jgi:hypothetical protein
MTHIRIDEFTRQYINTALWSSHDESDDDGGNPMDYNYSADDIHPDTLIKMVEDCSLFRQNNKRLIERLQYRHDSATDTQIAHDFWLTRCGHGAGFWDRGYGVLGDKMTEVAKNFGNVDLYVGDDGMIHQS